MYGHLLKAIVSHRVGHGPGRSEPHAVKRRRKPYPYSLNHGKKLATNYVELGCLLKVVPLSRILLLKTNFESFKVVHKRRILDLYQFLLDLHAAFHVGSGEFRL